jgi:hypothetical protein
MMRWANECDKLAARAEKLGRWLAVATRRVAESSASSFNPGEAQMKKHGFAESKASIANKLARATLPAHFS